MDHHVEPARSLGPLTLAIDIGGTGLKAGLLDSTGALIGERQRTPTPPKAAPGAVLDRLVALVQALPAFDRVSVGFPGVVRQGQVLTAPNLDNDAWRRFPLAAALAERLDRPVRMLNDATVHGLGVIGGHGVECVITLGTGFGFSLFQDGRPGPHLELAHHPLRKGMTYEDYVGNSALKAVGRKRWNKRVQRALRTIADLVGYDVLYLGGGNAKHLRFDLPDNVRIVSNDAGLNGGIRLWDRALDPAFAAG
jgi:polyphosphate glucokinase